MLPLAADYPLLNIIWTMLVFFGFFLWITSDLPRLRRPLQPA